MSNAYLDDGYHSGKPFQSASLRTVKSLNSFWFLKLDYNNNLKTLIGNRSIHEYYRRFKLNFSCCSISCSKVHRIVSQSVVKVNFYLLQYSQPRCVRPDLDDSEGITSRTSLTRSRTVSSCICHDSKPHPFQTLS